MHLRVREIARTLFSFLTVWVVPFIDIQGTANQTRKDNEFSAVHVFEDVSETTKWIY